MAMLTQPHTNPPLRHWAIAIAGAAALALSPLPALAFTTTTLPETAGNPGGQPLSQVEITANDIGQSFLVNWALAGSGNRADLSAQASFTVVEFTSSTLVLDVTLTNQTTGSFQAAIMSFGMAVNTTLSNLTFASAGSTFGSITPNRTGNFPGGFKDINVCIFVANTCSGGAIFNGLQSGGSGDNFRITLTGSFDSNVVLGAFPIKFQTEAGSYELAGTFGAASSTELITAEEGSTESSTPESSTVVTSTSQTQTTETVTTTSQTTTTFTQTVAQTILQQVSQQSSLSMGELRILEVSPETWPDGCLGLGQAGTPCTQALVSGYLVKVASRREVYVYRTNSTGSLVVIDQARTQEYRSRRSRRRRVKVSRQVHQSVLQTIATSYQVDASQLRVTQVRRKHWRDDCLGLPAGGGRGRACGRGRRVQGYMVVVTDGSQSWVCRSDRTGSYVVVDERATRLRRQQQQWRVSQQVVQYRDVSRSHWAWEYIQELSSLNILAGYPDGSYHPDQQVNRVELAAIVSRAFEYSELRQATSFTDISTNYWGYNAAQAAYQLGFLETLGGSTFQPQANISRAAALLAIANGLEIPSLTPSAAQSLLSNYSGLPTGGEVQQLLGALIQEGIFVNHPSGTALNLDQPITRAEVAVLIYQALASLGSVESIPADFTGGSLPEDEVEIVDDELLDDFDDLEAIPE